MDSENASLIRQLTDAASRNDTDAVAEIVVAHLPETGKDFHGLRGLLSPRARSEHLLLAFPDAEVRIQRAVVEGGEVKVTSTWHGTQRGGFLGLAPTGQEVYVTGVDVFHIAGGAIIGHTMSIENPSVLEQLDPSHPVPVGQDACFLCGYLGHPPGPQGCANA